MPLIIDIPPKAKFLYEDHADFKVLHGGRSSAKSTSVAKALVALAYSRKLRVLCAREIQKSIAESVHQLLQDQISSMGLQGFYHVKENEIVGRNGSQFLFAGLRTNFSTLKSKEGIDIVWVEEAATVSKESWRVLIPTIRKPGSEIWVTFNPEHEEDPASQMFIENPRPGALVVEMNWQDNPWFSDKSRREMEYDYRVDPETAAHVWGGQYLRYSNAVIFGGRKKPDGTLDEPKYLVEAFESNPAAWDGPWFGADFGFAQDPATLMKLWGNGRRLMVEYEAYGVGVELNELPAMYDAVPGSRLWVKQRDGNKTLAPQQPVIRADNSRPETISHLRGYGFNVVPAKKWPGSVEDGIAFLRSLEKIVIHPRCVHQEAEARLYKYKTDRVTGEVLPVIVDKHNHCWDADRYALEPAISNWETTGTVVHSEQVTISSVLDDPYDQGAEIAFREMSSW